MNTRQVIVVLMLCTTACLANNTTSPTGLCGIVTATPNTLAFNNTISIAVTISNAGPKTIVIDTTPDEILKPKTEQFGAVTRGRGSQLTFTLYQDLNADGRIEGFRTVERKVGFGTTEPSIVLSPGETHTETIAFVLHRGSWGSVSLQEGPVGVKAMLRLLIDGHWVFLRCRGCVLELMEDEGRTTKSTLSDGAAPSADPPER